MTAEDAVSLRGWRTQEQPSWGHLHGRRQTGALPECHGPLPRCPDQRRADPAQHGRLQLPATERLPRYWEFNYTTNWIHPLYELPFTGGFPDNFGSIPDALQDGEIGRRQSIVPGSGPLGVHNDPRIYGDNPNRPRDPDLFDAEDDAQREFRQRFIPSGLANEILLDVYVRRASFMPHEHNLTRRLYHAYADEVRRIDTNNDGVISAAEGDVDTGSDGFSDNSRLFLPGDIVQPFCGDARNQRRVAGAALCPKPARLAAARNLVSRQPCRAGLHRP